MPVRTARVFSEVFGAVASHTVEALDLRCAGPDSLLLVFVGNDNNSVDVDSVTFGGQSLSRLSSSSVPAQIFERGTVFYRVNPTSAPVGDLVVTFGGEIGSGGGFVAVVTKTGVLPSWSHSPLNFVTEIGTGGATSLEIELTGAEKGDGLVAFTVLGFGGGGPVSSTNRFSTLPLVLDIRAEEGNDDKQGYVLDGHALEAGDQTVRLEWTRGARGYMQALLVSAAPAADASDRKRWAFDGGVLVESSAPALPEFVGGAATKDGLFRPVGAGAGRYGARLGVSAPALAPQTYRSSTATAQTREFGSEQGGLRFLAAYNDATGGVSGLIIGEPASAATQVALRQRIPDAVADEDGVYDGPEGYLRFLEGGWNFGDQGTDTYTTIGARFVDGLLVAMLRKTNADGDGVGLVSLVLPKDAADVADYDGAGWGDEGAIELTVADNVDEPVNFDERAYDYDDPAGDGSRDPITIAAREWADPPNTYTPDREAAGDDLLEWWVCCNDYPSSDGANPVGGRAYVKRFTRASTSGPWSRGGLVIAFELPINEFKHLQGAGLVWKGDDPVLIASRGDTEDANEVIVRRIADVDNYDSADWSAGINAANDAWDAAIRQAQGHAELVGGPVISALGYQFVGCAPDGDPAYLLCGTDHQTPQIARATVVDNDVDGGPPLIVRFEPSGLRNQPAGHVRVSTGEEVFCIANFDAFRGGPIAASIYPNFGSLDTDEFPENEAEALDKFGRLWWSTDGGRSWAHTHAGVFSHEISDRSLSVLSGLVSRPKPRRLNRAQENTAVAAVPPVVFGRPLLVAPGAENLAVSEFTVGTIATGATVQVLANASAAVITPEQVPANLRPLPASGPLVEILVDGDYAEGDIRIKPTNVAAVAGAAYAGRFWVANVREFSNLEADDEALGQWIGAAVDARDVNSTQEQSIGGGGNILSDAWYGVDMVSVNDDPLTIDDVVWRIGRDASTTNQRLRFLLQLDGFWAVNYPGVQTAPPGSTSTARRVRVPLADLGSTWTIGAALAIGELGADRYTAYDAGVEDEYPLLALTGGAATITATWHSEDNAVTVTDGTNSVEIELPVWPLRTSGILIGLKKISATALQVGVSVAGAEPVFGVLTLAADVTPTAIETPEGVNTEIGHVAGFVAPTTLEPGLGWLEDLDVSGLENVDQTAPTPSGATIERTDGGFAGGFDSSEQLGTTPDSIVAQLTAPVTGNTELRREDFAEVDNGDGTWSYEFEQAVADPAQGVWTFRLTACRDTAGNMSLQVLTAQTTVGSAPTTADPADRYLPAKRGSGTPRDFGHHFVGDPLPKRPGGEPRDPAPRL